MFSGIDNTATAQIDNPLDCWNRLPKAGQRIAGLTRSSINQLILGENPAVESRLFKSSPKSKRGIRLVKMRGPNSLEEFINNLPR
jgi:hypothetical protein